MQPVGICSRLFLIKSLCCKTIRCGATERRSRRCAAWAALMTNVFVVVSLPVHCEPVWSENIPLMFVWGCEALQGWEGGAMSLHRALHNWGRRAAAYVLLQALKCASAFWDHVLRRRNLIRNKQLKVLGSYPFDVLESCHFDVSLACRSSFSRRC